MSNHDVPPLIQRFANDLGGTVNEVSGPVPDGSGFATVSFPLPKEHWLYQPGSGKYGNNVPPMPFRLGTEEDGLNVLPRIRTREEFAVLLRDAAKYAIKSSTMDGKEIDFDPDAMVQNFITGVLGYRTPNGLSSDEWANP